MKTWQAALAIYFQIIILYVALAAFYTDPSANVPAQRPIAALNNEKPSRKPLAPLPNFWDRLPEECPEEFQEPYKVMPGEPEDKHPKLTLLV